MTSVTGISASCTTFNATEPRKRPLIALWPRLPITIKLHFDDRRGGISQADLRPRRHLGACKMGQRLAECERTLSVVVLLDQRLAHGPATQDRHLYI